MAEHLTTDEIMVLMGSEDPRVAIARILSLSALKAMFGPQAEAETDDRWAGIPIETQLAFARQEVEILKGQMGDIIGFYKGLPECRREGACMSEVPLRMRGSALPDPRDRAIADLKSELAATRRTLAKASARLAELEDWLIAVLGATP